MPADNFTSRPPTQESGIRPDNVPRQKYHGDELADQLASLQPAAAPLDPLSSSELFDNESDDPQVIKPEAPLQKLRDRFISPLSKTAQTAIVIKSGSHEALVARLHRRHPMADKHGELIPSTCHSLYGFAISRPVWLSATIFKWKGLTTMKSTHLWSTGQLCGFYFPLLQAKVWEHNSLPSVKLCLFQLAEEMLSSSLYQQWFM
jgi:hypothetical protein